MRNKVLILIIIVFSIQVSNAQKLNSTNYTNVQMLEGEYPGKIIKFHFKGTSVGIAVAAGPDAGIIEYSIDNSP